MPATPENQKRAKTAQVQFLYAGVARVLARVCSLNFNVLKTPSRAIAVVNTAARML